VRVEEFEDFREGINGVMAFYGKTVSQFALDVWWAALKAYDLPAIIDAFNRHLASPDVGSYPPKPADIVRMLGGRTIDKALSAWAKVDGAVRRVGTYESVAFDDPLIHRALHEMGGWIAMGLKTEDEWPFVAKEFENRYRAYAARGETPEYPPVLLGIAQAHNEAKGIRSTGPRLIGNPVEAERVMRGGGNADLIGNASARECVLQLVAGIHRDEGR
jgi:hypothetical protein